MSKTLLSLIAVNNGQPIDLESVEITDSDGSFGVRRTDTGEIVVSAGTQMDNSQPGLFTYEFEDPAGDITYEVALKANPVQGSASESDSESEDPATYLRFYRYVAPEEAEASSESSSDSESEELVRGINLVRSPLVREAADGRDMFRMTFTTEDAVLMPVEVFAYLRGPVDPREQRDPNEYFKFVATPFTASIYPADSPEETQLPGFYRTNSVEFLVSSSEIAQEITEDINREIACLVAAYNKLDYLEPRGEVIINGSGEPTEVILLDEPEPEAYSFADGEQLGLVEEEFDNL